MTTREAGFVGLYASFPITPVERGTGLLRGMLALDESPGFRKMTMGRVSGEQHTESFSTTRLQLALESLGSGVADFLHLLPYWKNRDWAKAFEDSVFVYWNSSIPNRGDRPLSPYEKRFGDVGTLLVEYPVRRFVAEEESPFQARLVRFLKRIFIDQRIHWVFVNRGVKALDETGMGLDPLELGKDRAFLRSRGGVPMTAFDTDLELAAGYFKEYTKGAFWGNILNRHHVDALGGWGTLSGRLSCEITEQLNHAGAYLQVSRSPVDPHTAGLIGAYQNLRRILRPILLETTDDALAVQNAVMGEWTPDSAR